MPIYHTDEPNLKGFTTTEKDKKRGVDRFPPEEFRDRGTDLLIEKDTGKKMKITGIDFDGAKKVRD